LKIISKDREKNTGKESWEIVVNYRKGLLRSLIRLDIHRIIEKIGIGRKGTQEI
jgi:hypothetical protein